MGNLVGKEDESQKQQPSLRKHQSSGGSKQRISSSGKLRQQSRSESHKDGRTAYDDHQVAEQLVKELKGHEEAPKDGVQVESQGKVPNEEVVEDENTNTVNLEDEEEVYAALENDNKVPMVFRWDGGGKNVYITGTFNKWSEKIPMRRSGNDFLYIRELNRGKHAYKFIVDDEWRFATDQPTVADPHGYINNFVDLTNFTGSFGADMKSLYSKDHITNDELYSSFCPDPRDPHWYAKEPPPLPPHLRQIILNSSQTRDCLAAKSMQVPQHVTLNHLYCSAIKENLMVLGVTQRYREKFVTTVFYSPLPDANIIGRAAAAAAPDTLNISASSPSSKPSPSS